MKELITFPTPEEAHVAASYLQAQGVDAVVADAHTLGAMPYLRVGLGGARILVDEHQADRARYLLDLTEEEVPARTCQQCGGPNLIRVRDSRVSFFHLLFFFLFPFSRATQNLRCRTCGHKQLAEDTEKTAA